MRLVTFASGSSGNCSLIETASGGLLLDAGISCRKICQALRRCGRTPEELWGILITHEHDDHVRALSVLLRRAPLRVFAPAGAALALRERVPELSGLLEIVEPERTFSLGDLTLTPFSTPHDARESVGYIIAGEGGRLGFCTDTGTVTEEMLSAMLGSDAALIEANHDLDMLRRGPYPYPLKRRILSERGHLCNDASAVFACRLAGSGTRTIALGHLSRENNTPRLAYDTVRSALDGCGHPEVALHVAPAEGELVIEVTPCSA